MDTMKSMMRLMLMTVVACCLGLGVAACSSDNDENGVDNRIVIEGDKTGVPDSLLTAEERLQLSYYSVVTSVMRNLTGLDQVSPDDVTSKTHEPTYGMTLDDESSTVRVMKSYDTYDAEILFRSLTGLDDEAADLMLKSTPDGYELSLRNLPVLPGGKTLTLGTLYFHRDTGPRRYAWVDVDIACIPHLERIDFLSAEAFPDNADCPYQVGDVVNVDYNVNGYCGGYYLCVSTNGHYSTLVHLCMGEPGGFNTVNFDGDSHGCWVPWNGVKKNDKTTLQDIKDYVYFILENQAKVASIKGFMRDEAYDLHPGWKGELDHLFPEGFNNDQGVAYVNTWGAHDGCRVYYDAEYGSYAVVPAYDYRHPIYAHIPHNCKNGNEVSYHKDKYVYDSDFKTSHQYYTMNAIHTDRTINGIKLELSATKTLLFGVPATNATTEHLGWCFADDGILYENAGKAEKYGHKPLGILAFVNTGKGEWMNLASEKESGFGHGLVLSYYWANNGQTCSILPQQGVKFNEDTGFDHYVDDHMKSVIEDFDGLLRTQELDMAGSPAAKAAITMTPVPPTSTSGWFIPSAGQWLAILCDDRLGGKSGLGDAPWFPGSDSFYREISHNPIQNINKYLYATLDRQAVWTTSAFDPNRCIYMYTYNNPYFRYSNEVQPHVRPVFAF